MYSGAGGCGPVCRLEPEEVGTDVPGTGGGEELRAVPGE